MHETFPNPHRVVNSKPGKIFQVHSIGWGVFNIPITIHWNPCLGLRQEQEALRLDHYLQFSKEDEYRVVAVRFPKDAVMPLLTHDEGDFRDLMRGAFADTDNYKSK